MSSPVQAQTQAKRPMVSEDRAGVGKWPERAPRALAMGLVFCFKSRAWLHRWFPSVNIHPAVNSLWSECASINAPDDVPSYLPWEHRTSTDGSSDSVYRHYALQWVLIVFLNWVSQWPCEQGSAITICIQTRTQAQRRACLGKGNGGHQPASPGLTHTAPLPEPAPSSLSQKHTIPSASHSGHEK